MEFLKRKNTFGSRPNSPTRKPSSKLSQSSSISDKPDECRPHPSQYNPRISRSHTDRLTRTVIVVEGSRGSTDTAPLPRAASLVSLHVAPVSSTGYDNSQQLEALRDELAQWKAKAETFEARMLDALARAEQADARLERIAAECHQDKDAMHKQLTELEVAKETACSREQEAIRRTEEAEVRNAHLVDTLAVFQDEVATLRDLAERSAKPILRARVPIPLGEEVAAEERASDHLRTREGMTYLIKSVLTGTVAKVSAIGQCLWAGQPSGGDDEKVHIPLLRPYIYCLISYLP
jgi:hypothetical protein